ncbi:MULTISPECIES: TetR/AcrR family transcriptional regulator [unclassified Corynebacterium]|uniref:TetR/AcrR family transcriptional regulator n=1 Tax=unclassified Corynebacterium TaxID=2624378 RepID=UPI0029C9D98A|nr:MULTISPECIES: TetR/AcrR family transcriptional regulator [unclassified Corynebacterium]WPF65611.1 TetR/AcrR family transcriptional regulator [Corynebacterium sp. 22KM0430]WPF68106.1 TetR/AcrR family transcriptional regulator [Corynebacterium sp. 21KM1197]
MANQQRRSQIAAAALALFSQRGYNATGMEDIAGHVGIATSSLYNHVGSKRELLTEVILSTLRGLLEDHRQGLRGIVTPSAQLHTAMRLHVRYHALHAQATRVVNNEIAHLDAPSRAQATELRREYVRCWQRIIAAGVETGEFAVGDVKVSVYALIDMGLGVCLWFDPQARYSAEELGTMYADMALRGITR